MNVYRWWFINSCRLTRRCVNRHFRGSRVTERWREKWTGILTCSFLSICAIYTIKGKCKNLNDLTTSNYTIVVVYLYYVSFTHILSVFENVWQSYLYMYTWEVSLESPGLPSVPSGQWDRMDEGKRLPHMGQRNPQDSPCPLGTTGQEGRREKAVTHGT